MAAAVAAAPAAALRLSRHSHCLLPSDSLPRSFHSSRSESARRKCATAFSAPADGPVSSEQANDRLVSIWDSNAEGVRGRWNTGGRSRSAAAEEQPRDDAPKTDDAWQWWIPGPDDDAYDYEDGSDDEEDDSFLSWLGLGNLDVMSVISIFKWIIPAAAILLPWFFGGPMLFMMTFIFFPWARKLVLSILKLLWPGQNSQEKSRYRQHKSSSSGSNKGRSTSFWKWKIENEFSKDDYDEESVNGEGQISRLGDWGDFDEDFLMLQKISRSSSKTGLEKRKNKKETPLIIRLVVAVFPFLRSWGGFL